MYFENAVVQAVRYLNRVRKWKLSHPVRMAVEIQPAGQPRGGPVCLELGNLPSRGLREKSMNGDCSTDVSQGHVEGVLLTVGIERLLIETVGPRSKEWDARETWMGP